MEYDDVEIDGKGIRVASVGQLQEFIKLSNKLKGIRLTKEISEIALRLWSEMDDREQAKFERSTFGKSLGINFEKHKAKGMW